MYGAHQTQKCRCKAQEIVKSKIKENRKGNDPNSIRSILDPITTTIPHTLRHGRYRLRVAILYNKV